MTDDIYDGAEPPPYDPVADEDEEPAEPTKPLGQVLNVLSWGLAAFMLGQAVNAAYALALITTLHTAWLQPSDIELFTTPVAIVFAGTLLGGTVCYFWFIYRALANAKKFSHRHIRDSPLGSILWHFIPGVGWVKPYQIMRLVWVRSHNPIRGEGDAPNLISLWWWAWVAVNLAAGVSAMLQQIPPEGHDHEVRTLTVIHVLNVFASVMGIASALYLLPVARGITEAQDAIERTAAFKD